MTTPGRPTYLHPLATPDTPRPYVCPWCGARFGRRFIASDGLRSLEEHWRRHPECSANRNVNNPTQTKYLGPEDELA